MPVLFGNKDENPDNPLLKMRAAAFVFGYPEWKANSVAPEREIVHELAAMARTIAARHPGKKMGIIGLCLTGSFPLELMAEKPSLDFVNALVISQPSIPVYPEDFEQRQSLGMPKDKLEEIAAIIQRRGLKVMGFRFQLEPDLAAGAVRSHSIRAWPGVPG